MCFALALQGQDRAARSVHLQSLSVCEAHPRRYRAGIAQDYAPRGVGINSNDAANYPQDGPKEMAKEAKDAGYIFHYLYDEKQSVAKAYRAACTPDIFLFDRGRRLVYRGQFDASRPGNGIPVTGKDVRAALDAVLAGKQASLHQAPSVGCSIKWKRF
jgi:hypothetical protein